jgi:hypothetical protein
MALQGYTRRHSWDNKSAAQNQAKNLKSQFKSVRVVRESGVFVNDVRYVVYTKGSKR